MNEQLKVTSARVEHSSSVAEQADQPLSETAQLAEALEAVIQNVNTQVDVNNALTNKLLMLEDHIRELENKVSASSGSPNNNFAVYLGDKLALTRVLDRFKMYVDTTDISIASHLMAHGYWEMWITKVFQRLVKPGMTVLDIGANCGYYTLIAAAGVWPNGRVHAVEPDPRNFEILQKNIAVNGFDGIVKAHALAALDTHKDVRLYTKANFLGGHSLFVSRPDDKGYRPITVPALPLDELIQGKVDVIKMDAEGSEPLIIEGMTNLLAANPQIKIIMEFSPHTIPHTGHDAAQFLERLEQLGFSLSLITTDSTLEPLDKKAVLKEPISMLYLSREESNSSDYRAE